MAPNDPDNTIVVESADQPGQRVAARVGYGTAITPGLVTQVIPGALDQVWTPRERGVQMTYSRRSAML